MTQKVTDPPEQQGHPQETSDGLSIRRMYTQPDIHPFEQIEWVERSAKITSERGTVIFEQDNVEVPRNWSQLATDIAVSKYFRKSGVPGAGQETSVKQLVNRVAHTIRSVGEEDGYFATKDDADSFEAELAYLLVTQRGAFNSPVWFNCGLHHEYGITGGGGNWHWDHEQQKIVQLENNYEHPQCSACFIQGVDDSLDSMTELQRSEVTVFKYGSGSGTNFSKIRGKGEPLSGGGESSGVLSFLEGFDRWAGSIKSGGTTRHAAKMVCLDMDHPEISEFVNWKVREEKKVAALVAGGYSSDFNGDAYHTVSGQNSNNSVRIPDEFMQAYLSDGEWQTRQRITGEAAATLQARDLMHQVAEAAWKCADPGVQFDSIINDWHTCTNSDKIYASNPCSEYMFLDDSACNLASINLTKYLDADGHFDIEGFRHACRIFFIAQEILVDFSSYPTEQIATNSHVYRPLGLGYANLGALLMRNGIPYDSPKASAVAGAITAVLCGHAYRTSAEVAQFKGPFEGFAKNRTPMLRVMNKHRAAAYRIDPDACLPSLLKSAQQEWDEVVRLGELHGYRNAQATVLAPTGTIGLLMDCDTTGVEPDFALVKFKKLAGGGSFKIVNQSVPMALTNLGYTPRELEEIIAYAQGTLSLKNGPHVNEQSLRFKGLTDEEIGRIEDALPSAFELRFAFNPKVLGPEAMQRLGIPEEEFTSPQFDFLSNVGFTSEQIEEASRVICGTMTLEGAPHLKEEELAVFDCANRCGSYGERFIEPMGHIRMMSAVQPFLSGSISKTVNVPHEATVEDIENLYVEAWKMSLKAVAIYRDGSKLSQPLTSRSEESEETESEELRPARRRLPDERRSITHKFSIGGHEGYMTVGMYDDGTPGEVFLRMAKEGSVISGLMDTVATMTSVALQYGVPMEALVRKFSHMRFEPSGFTNNPQIPIAKSIVDYVFRWIGHKFIDQTDPLADEDPSLLRDPENGSKTRQAVNPGAPRRSLQGDSLTAQERLVHSTQSDAPACFECGAIMVRNGTCYRCLNCGSTSGCS